MNKSKYGSPPPHTPEKKKKEKALNPPQTPKGSISKQTTPPTAPSPPASLPLPNEIQGRVRFGDEGWGRGVGGASAPAFEKWRFCREGTAWAGVRAGPRPPGGRRARGRSAATGLLLPALARAQRPRPPRRGGTGRDTGHRSSRRGGRRGDCRASSPLPQSPPPRPAPPFAKLRVFISPGQELGGFRSPPCPGLRLYFSRRESCLLPLNPDPLRSDPFGNGRSLPLPRAHLPTAGGMAGSRSPGHGAPGRWRGAPKRSGFARGWENRTGSAPPPPRESTQGVAGARRRPAKGAADPGAPSQQVPGVSAPLPPSPGQRWPRRGAAGGGRARSAARRAGRFRDTG